jgi:hypothetical protein
MAHGYRPGRLLYFAFGFILVGSWLFGLGDRLHLMAPTKAEAYTPYEQTGQVPAFYPTFRPWLYSLDTFLPIINFGQKDHWRPRDTAPTASGPMRLHLVSTDAPIPSSSHQMATGEKAKSVGWADAMYQRASTIVSTRVASGSLLRWYLYVHTAFGWVLITLGIAGVTGLVRREQVS